MIRNRHIGFRTLVALIRNGVLGVLVLQGVACSGESSDPEPEPQPPQPDQRQPIEWIVQTTAAAPAAAAAAAVPGAAGPAAGYAAAAALPAPGPAGLPAAAVPGAAPAPAAAALPAPGPAGLPAAAVPGAAAPAGLSAAGLPAAPAGSATRGAGELNTAGLNAFGVYAYCINAPYLTNHEFAKSPSTTAGNTLFVGNPAAYWPLGNETVTFFAYAPYGDGGLTGIAYAPASGSSSGETSTGETFRFNYTPAAVVSKQEDLCVGAVSASKPSPASTPVPLTLKHCLTSIGFKAKYSLKDGASLPIYDNASTVVVIDAIKVKKVAGTGTLTLSTNTNNSFSWSSPSTSNASDAEYVIDRDSGDLNSAAELKDSAYGDVLQNGSGILYLLPQTVGGTATGTGTGTSIVASDAEVEVIFSYNTKDESSGTIVYKPVAQFSQTLKLPNDTWEAGKKITYSMTIYLGKSNEVKIESVLIEDWLEGKKNTDVIE